MLQMSVKECNHPTADILRKRLAAPLLKVKRMPCAFHHNALVLHAGLIQCRFHLMHLPDVNNFVDVAMRLEDRTGFRRNPTVFTNCRFS